MWRVRWPLSVLLLWLVVSTTGPAACFGVLATIIRVVAAPSPPPKVVLGSREGTRVVLRSRSTGSGGQAQRRLFGFTRRSEQERAGEEGKWGEEQGEEEERRGAEEGDAATGAGRSPAARHDFATGIRRARALVAATGLALGKGLGMREAAALVKATAPREEAEEDNSTTAGEGRGAAPATGHAVGASVQRGKSLVAMVGERLSAAPALRASTTGPVSAPPADETSTSRPKKAWTILSDTRGGHRASSQQSIAAPENLHGNQVTAFLKAMWANIKRRGSLFALGLLYSFAVVPMQMLGGIAKHRDGVGYFSDPLGKPSLLTYWRTLVESAFGTVLLLPKRPADLALAAVEDSGDGVTVLDRGSYLEFTPPGLKQDLEATETEAPPLVGMVILPGAFIPPLAYAPLARTMARKGHPSYIVRFDYNLANHGWERIGEVIPPLAPSTEDDDASAASAEAAEEKGERGETDNCLATSTPTKWVLVGHSMGVMAIEKWYPENSARVNGVVLLGAGNRIGDAFAGAGVPAMLMRGSRDPFTPPEELEKAAHKLPKDTESVMIEGGNHRGFGHYTRQPLDWEATITPQEQQRIVEDALVDFIARRVVAGEPSMPSTLP